MFGTADAIREGEADFIKSQGLPGHIGFVLQGRAPEWMACQSIDEAKR
jgi:hypothetical protein